MTASYPTSVKTFTTKTDGVDYPLASHVNSLQDEVTAIETTLKANWGGTPAQGGVLYYNGTAWTPLAAGTSTQLMQTRGSSANPIWYTADNAGWVNNYTITTSRAANAETINLVAKSGSAPSSTDPIHIAFRNATAATGDYTVLELTSSYSITIPSTATMGMSNSTPARLWLVGFNDAGTFRLGVVNTQLASNVGIFPLRNNILSSSTLIDTASDNAGVIYTGTAVTTKAMRVLGYLEYTLATAGTWNTAPSVIEIWNEGDPLPGDVIQLKHTAVTSSTTGTTVVPLDDTIPTNTEGNALSAFDTAITPTNATNRLRISHFINISYSVTAIMTSALYQDSSAALCAGITLSAGDVGNISFVYWMSAGTTSSTTFKIRAGGNNAGTFTLNGRAGSRIYGGVLTSYLMVEEVMI